MTIASAFVVRVCRWLLNGWCVFFVIPASAMQIDITAKFAPDPANPYLNKFKNTTPVSGRCSPQKDCLRLPVKFESSAEIVARHSVRRGPMFKVPSEWQAVEIRNKITGEAKFVKIRIAGIGSEYVTDAVNGLVGGTDFNESHIKLWVGWGGWVNAPRPCTATTGASSANEYSFTFFWKTPVAGVCAKTAAFAIPWMNYSYLDISYELDTPSPLDMSAGQYSGQLNLTIGPGGDFDMGDVMIPSDDTLTLNFTLDVEHELKIEIPPGGNRVELVPEGGWQAWLQNPARIPDRIYRDQIFHISASSPFKMYTYCHGRYSFLCELNNEVGDYATYRVLVSLPNGFVDENGRPITRLKVEAKPEAKLIRPGFYMDRQPGVLHFEIHQVSIRPMLNYPGTHYSGAVSVMWDSEI